MNLASRLRLPLVVVVAFTLQQTVLTSLSIHGEHPDIMVLVVTLAALIGGPQRGAVIGFLVGLVTDLFLQTPMGLSALTFTVVGFAAGSLRTAVVETAAWLVPVGALAGSAVAVVLYAVLEALMGQPGVLHHGLAWVVVVVSVVNGALSLPAIRVLRWAMEAAPERPASSSALGGRWGPGLGR